MIIGFCGSAYAGKTTSAEFLVKNFNFRRISFANSLKKNIGQQIFALSDEQLFGNLKEVVDPRWGLSPRQILQKAGNELRNIHTNIWVDNLIRTAKAYPKDVNLTIDDVRYPNEIQSLREIGATIVRIVRPGHSSLGASESKHPSETALDTFKEYDVTIKASSTEDLEAQIEKLFLGLNKNLG